MYGRKGAIGARRGNNSLIGSLPNGVNNHSLDLPDYNGTPLKFNGNPCNGMPSFSTDAFSLNVLGTPGTASRRSFHGPGALNFDLGLVKNMPLGEKRNLQVRVEAFNAFNHAQFFGPCSASIVLVRERRPTSLIFAEQGRQR